MPDRLICDDRNTKEDVEECTCPYAEEVYDKLVTAYLCSDCHTERFLSI